MLRQSRFLLGVVSLVLVLFQGGASATPLKRNEVPAPLQAWTDWALAGHTKQLCPFLDGAAENFRCAWPGRLELQLGETQGQFSQQWLVHDPGWVYLPGNIKLWPQDVRVDGTASATLARAGTPTVWLEKGTHRVSGEFLWDAPPELLKIPNETGIIQLTLRGEKVDFPRRNEKGELWLQQRNLDDSGEKSRLEVVVHRLLTDAIPVQLTTRIELRVSGKSREVLLGRVLPEGWTPLSFRTPVPARLEPDGHLRVQVRPGTWVLHLESHYDAPLAEVKRPQPDGLWDKHEVWTFAARPALRVVEVSGAARVDPQQTLLPEEWRSYPAFLMESDSRLILEEKRRGDADPVADRLSLTRQWWLDFDGEGYTVHDEMSGVINRSNRIEMQPETTLGRLALNGKDQFITNLNAETNQVGVEVPLGRIQLEADSRIEAVSNSTISAVSWDQDFHQVSGLLHLPPGWDVLHIGGVDEASETWVKNWDLLNLFMVLVLSMAFFRLWGPAWGVAALLTLVLTYTEYGAPNWAWVHLLIAEALFRAVPEGKFDRWVKGYRFAAIAGLVLISLSFMVTELRTASFPALEYPWTTVQRFEAMEVQQEMPSEEGRVRLQSATMDSIPSKKKISSAYRDDVFDSFSKSSDFAPDKNARITTGPGLPTWTWNSVNLIWHGPVARDQALHLYLLSPACNLFFPPGQRSAVCSHFFSGRRHRIRLVMKTLLWRNWQISPVNHC